MITTLADDLATGYSGDEAWRSRYPGRANGQTIIRGRSEPLPRVPPRVDVRTRAAPCRS